MIDTSTIVLGIKIPSTSPAFLTIIGIHVALGLSCAVTGLIAMLINKGQGRHSTFGKIYYWSLLAVFVSATFPAVTRWNEDYHLLVLGTFSFAAAHLGRTALRRRWRNWVKLHITGMGTSYILLLTAFYVDNGKSLPLWKELPPTAYWLLPGAVGIPLIVRALLRHPLVHMPRQPASY